MLSDLQVSVTTNRVLIVIVLVMALGTTTARICIRCRNRRLWWDDGCVSLATPIIITMAVAYFLADLQRPPTTPHAHRLKLIQIWILIPTYTCAVWSARLSLMLSIVRLIPTFMKLRRISEWATISFLLMCISALIAKIYTCGSDLSWYLAPNPVYLILIVIPLRLLSHITLDRNKRRMVILMFSANLITSMITIIRGGLVIADAWGLVSIAVEAEVGIGIIAANLAVLTPYIYRLVKRAGDFDSKPYTYYRSVQPDGGIRLRRVADIAPNMPVDPTLQLVNPEHAVNIPRTSTKSEDDGYALHLDRQSRFLSPKASLDGTPEDE
ncbi:hypothetical protein GYMLUDRAFT_582473 [Collybiopsis luxurians FD-317 M1]|uniref:Integral membrane protein n=1 Tax=Collybiopsis luxurians FD-317 M1 TaxID=944289 RepID=A0A0D0CYH0_9AGAR|nr:hypothetical protein GYMLUDRAFT_582473 [Collybiopsis luxurians FD-317 M1]